MKGWGGKAEVLEKRGCSKNMEEKAKAHVHDRHWAARGKGCNFSSKGE